MNDTRYKHRAHDLALLQDLFDAVVRTMREAQGTRDTVSSDYYVDAAAVRRTVEQALRRVECDSLDGYRVAIRLGGAP
jgi:hypothetical protein